MDKLRIAVLLLAIAVAGCGGDKSAAEVVGQWILENVVIDDVTTAVDGDFTLSIRSDGTYTEETDGVVVEEGTWYAEAVQHAMTFDIIVGEGGTSGEHSRSYGFATHFDDVTNLGVLLSLFPDESALPGTPSEYQYRKVD